MSNFDLEQKPSRALWLFAALAAFVLHVGGAALAVNYLHEAEPDDAFGMPAIEIGIEMTAPRREATDLPAGPDKEASLASIAQSEQKAELKASDLPKEQPSESVDADRAVAAESTNEPAKDSGIAEVATTASVESVAREATAMPSSEAIPEAVRAVAPTQGMGASAQLQRANWQKQLLAHLDRHKRFPAEHARKRAELVVSFVLDRRGHVLSTGIVKGSGDAAFDEAALAMVKRSDPVPQPPPSVADEGLNFTLPVNFK